MHHPKTEKTEKTEQTRKKDAPAVIALRKACDADGTGLSHYILMDGKDAR